MATLTDYFKEIAYQPKYSPGDRVCGHWNGVPIMGTVGSDTLVTERQEPQIHVFLDLPVKHRGITHNFVIAHHSSVKSVVKYTAKQLRE